MKPKPIPALFLAQPGGALVGEGKPFKDHWELCRHAHKLGAQGVTVPGCAPYIDLDAATGSKATLYCRELLSRYEDCGTPLLRFENHIDAQPAGGIHSSRVVRFQDFFKPENPDKDLRARARQFQNIGTENIKKVILASGALGLNTLVAWSGGRGWAAAQYPWSAYPANYRDTILAFLIYRWQGLLELAAANGIKKTGMELHPESDIHSPLLLKLWKDATSKVSPRAADLLSANGDPSHPTLIGDDAAEHMRFLQRHDLLGTIHLKDGCQLACPGGSLYGDFAPSWSESRRRFQTFGTGQANWGEILPTYHSVHQNGPVDLPFVAELECSWLKDMMQGMEVALENAVRASEGRELLDPAHINPNPPQGDWEKFIWVTATAAELLELDTTEESAVATILQQMQS